MTTYRITVSEVDGNLEREDMVVYTNEWFQDIEMVITNKLAVYETLEQLQNAEDAEDEDDDDDPYPEVDLEESDPDNDNSSGYN